MILKNISKHTIISKDLKEVRSFVDQTFGLLRKSNPGSLLFKTRFGIHTLGLKQSIDVIVLNNNYVVVKVCKNLKSNSLFFWNPEYSIVLELPANSIEKSKTIIGDKLLF